MTDTAATFFLTPGGISNCPTAGTCRSSFARLQRLRLARKLDEPRAITSRIATFPFLRPLDHGTDCPLTFMRRVAQDHPKLRHRRREFQIRRSVLELGAVIDE